MLGFDQLWVWRDAAIAGALDWYRSVACNRMPAKFRIAATLPLSLSLAESSETRLWGELERLTPSFLERQAAIRAGEAALGARCEDDSLLELCGELTQRMLRHCNFCAWDCQVDRGFVDDQGGGPEGGQWGGQDGVKLGACKLASETRVSSFFHHQGEELVYRGTRGSGTIFFTSCNMRCAFCQNGDISTDKDNGLVVSPRVLAAMAWLLRIEGCHNINWVGGDPAIHLHSIVAAIALLGSGMQKPDRDDLGEALRVKADGFDMAALSPEQAIHAGAFNAPMLWNSNFYLSDEAMKILRLLTDVWLPDFKFGPGRCAIDLARTPNYWPVVTGMLRRVRGWGDDMTIRHLVMPGHVECCTVPVLDWIAENMPQVPVNVMEQYRPDMACDPNNAGYMPRYAGMARPPKRGEIRAAYAHARKRGLNFEAITHEKARRGLFG